jgi:hypothetical protein
MTTASIKIPARYLTDARQALAAVDLIERTVA